MLYLDHAATSPLRPEVADAMAPFLGLHFGNPSGMHEVSRHAKNALEEARERAAAAVGAAHPLEIVFTGGGTEADNLAVQGAALADPGGGGAVVSAVEHEAVLESARFLQRLGRTLAVVDVDGSGIVSPREVAAALSERAGVVSVMAANNETGALQPVLDVSAAVREVQPDVVVHTDAVQAFVSEDVLVATLGVDLMTLAAHKLGGPMGVGLLYVRNGVDLEPVLHGGGQELGRRSGTHNVAGIVGMAAALELALADRGAFRERVGACRDGFEDELAALVPDVVFTVPRRQRLVQHSHLRIPGLSAETMLIRLDAAGLAASAGSACHSGATGASHVLAAMGLASDIAGECVRFSFGWTNRPGDGVAAARIVAGVVEDLR